MRYQYGSSAVYSRIVKVDPETKKPIFIKRKLSAKGKLVVFVRWKGRIPVAGLLGRTCGGMEVVVEIGISILCAKLYSMFFQFLHHLSIWYFEALKLINGSLSSFNLDSFITLYLVNFAEIWFFRNSMFTAQKSSL